MSCEQTVWVGYEPVTSEPIDTTQATSLGECSQRCCNDGRCGIYSYYGDTGQCTTYRLPDQLIYLPFPTTRDMLYTGDPKLNTGVLMKRKITTWVPWLAVIVIVLAMLWCWRS